MLSPKHVFISFKTEEREFAFQLKTALDNSGYIVWWQEKIQCGQEWHGEIDKAIEEAGAIVVLWSNKSMTSTWVRHEASQAIVRGVYSPVRLQPMEISSPFNRVQATDIINWSGDPTHPGFQNLLVRLHELMPPPIPFWQKSKLFIWRHRAVIVLSAIAIVALALLLRQSMVLNKQIEKQEETFKNVQKQSKALLEQRTTMQSQIEKQNELLISARNQSDVLKKQLEQQNTIISTVSSSGLLLQDNIKTQGITLNVLKTTSEDLKALNFPIVNGLSYSFKIRIYTEGIKRIWKEKKTSNYLLLSQMDTISSFVKKRIFEFPQSSYKKYDPYETLFSNIASAIGVSTILKYQLPDKANSIYYFENGANTYRTWASTKNIYFDPVNEYFETDFFISSGAIKTNPDGITNLFTLFDNADIFLLFRFAGEASYKLPINNSEDAIVQIKKIVVSDFSQIRYGNNFQFMMNPNHRTREMNYEEIKKTGTVEENIKEEDRWRYNFVRIPLSRN